MNIHQKAIDSAEKIWDDILNRPVMGAFLKGVNATIKLTVIEEWARIIKNVFLED